MHSLIRIITPTRILCRVATGESEGAILSVYPDSAAETTNCAGVSRKLLCVFCDGKIQVLLLKAFLKENAAIN